MIFKRTLTLYSSLFWRLSFFSNQTWFGARLEFIFAIELASFSFESASKTEKKAKTGLYDWSSITFIRPSKSQSRFWDTFWTSIPPQTSLSTLKHLFHTSDPPSKVYRTRFHHKIYRKSFFHNQIAIDMTYKLLWKSDSKVVHKSLFLIQKEAIIVLKPSRVSLNRNYYGSQ